MANYYVDSTRTDDTGDGSLSAPKKTFAAALALCTVKGDTLGVINTADCVWTAGTVGTSLPAGTKGTSFVDYGTLVYGCNSSGNPAKATISPGVAGSCSLIRIGVNTGYLIIRDITFNSLAFTSDTGSHVVCQHHDSGAPDPGPVRFEACAWLGAGTGVQPAGARVAVTITAGPVGLGLPFAELEGCYFQNCDGQTVAGGSAGRDVTFDKCLFYCDWTTASAHENITWSAFESASAIMRVKNCTFYTSVGAQAINNCIDYPASNGTNVGDVSVYNNLWFIETTSGSTNAIFMQGVGGAASVTNAGIINYNGFIGGPNFTAAGEFSVSGPYNEVWGTSGVFKANDQQLYGQTESTVFGNPSSTYQWDPMGTGRYITILKDLRPKVFLTASSTGGVLGALPSVQSDIAVALSASRTSPETGESVIFTMTVTNGAAQADSIICTLPVATGLTYSSAVVSQGSYNSGTGQWAIGTLLAAGSATLTLTITVNAGQGGNSIVSTATYVSSNITDTNGANDVAQVTLTVMEDSVPGGGGDGDNPYLDVLPIFADYLTLDANCRLQTRVNRERETYVRFDKRRSRFREFSDKRIVVAPSTTLTINMGGIQRGKYIVVESDFAVRVSLSTSGDKYLPAATVVFVAMSDFEILKVQNQSSTTAATVQIGVVD